MTMISDKIKNFGRRGEEGHIVDRRLRGDGDEQMRAASLQSMQKDVMG